MPSSPVDSCSIAPLLHCSPAPLLPCSIALLLHCSPILQISVISQSRDTQKHVFEFVYHGTFNVDMWKENRSLGLQSIHLCQGSHGYWYALIKVETKKRAQQIQKLFEEFDREATSAMQIKLTNLPGEPVIVSFGLGYEFMDHTIFKQIEGAHKNQCSSFFTWSKPGYQGFDINKTKRGGFGVLYRKWNQDIQRQLDIENDLNYDVVKKRNAMDSAPADEENTPEALAAFESFEASVLPALEMIAQYENKFLRQEMVEMEESFAKGEAATGGVYFAWSPCLGCMKIGATHKEDPDVRLRQISSFVTTPFILVAWLPTPTPFRMEAAAHRHFSQQRINSRGSGAGTEFFRIGEAEAVTYVAGV